MCPAGEGGNTSSSECTHKRKAETRAVASVPRSNNVMSVYEWDDNDHPLAYFITFRTHGTWLHGDRRGSVDRHGRNVFGSERIGLDPIYSVKMEGNMTSEPVLLNAPMRVKVEEAIRAVCASREYGL